VKPFFFGDSRRPLFGVHHPPRGRARRAGVVICPPFGQEYLRAHRSLRELASRLADAGFHTLRFDLHGAGDSAGEAAESRLAGWREDVASALAEVRENAGSPRAVLVGLRLGATLAALAAANDPDVAALVLWDPVTDGAAYVRELRAAHETWLREHARGAALEPGEVLGIPFPAALAADLEGVDLTAVPPRAPRILVVSSDLGDGAPPSPWPSATPDGLERRRFAPSPVWLHAEGMNRSLAPVDVLDGVAAWLAEVCP
jgi:exosortase A-associated hydrolase 2